jgi:hypothetical protein
MNSWKFYELPIDTCLSTARGNGLIFHKPGLCLDGTRARMARYWDYECKDLFDITFVKDEDLVWDNCQVLSDTTREMGSIAFYCDGSRALGGSSEAIVEASKGKATTLPGTTLKIQTTPLPPKLWVPFWKGLILVDMVGSTPEDQYTNPKFEVLATDTCHTELHTPLKIF